MISLFSSNPVFRQFPWFSEDLNLEPMFHQKYIHQLQAHIASGENFTDSPSHEYIKTQLGIIPHGSDLAPTNTSKEYAFAMFMLRYRVLDIGLWLSRGSPSPSGTIPRGIFPSTQSLSRFSLLADWPSVVHKAEQWVAKYTQEVHPPPESHHCQTASMKYLNDYIKKEHFRKQECILNNIDLAVLYLSHLIEGHSDLDESNAPELLQQELKLDPKLKLIQIKNPLHMALAISPLCLLLPTDLAGITYGRSKMLQLWKALGSDRPKYVQIAEKELWTLIFALATSPDLNTQEEILMTLQRIQVKISPDSGALTLEDLFFFKPAPSSSGNGEASTSRQSHRFVELEEEEEEDEEN